MIHHFRALGLALAVVFALSVAGATTASAQQGYLTSDGPVTLTVEQTGDSTKAATGPMTLEGTQTGSEGSNALTAFEGSLQCSSATYTSSSVSSGASQITLTPSYGACSGIGAKATVDMNGCDYLLKLESTNGTDAYKAKTTLSCTAGKHVVFTLFESEAHSKSFCKLTITEKAEGYAGLTATDSTKGTVNVAGTVEGLEIHKEGEGVLCTEKLTTKVGKLDLDISLKGPRSIGLSDAGGTSKFSWPENPHESTTSNQWEMFGIKGACVGSSFTGHEYNQTPHESIPSGATSITLTPLYNQEACIFGTWPMTIDMNGCDYVLNIGQTTEEADTYGVTTDVVCPEGKDIQMTIFTTKAEDPSTPFCTLHIAEQTGLSGLHATDLTTGEIGITGSASALHMTRTNHGAHALLCPNNTTTAVTVVKVDLRVSGDDELGDPTEIGLSHD